MKKKGDSVDRLKEAGPRPLRTVTVFATGHPLRNEDVLSQLFPNAHRPLSLILGGQRAHRH
jgi:hypothetical protein